MKTSTENVCRHPAKKRCTLCGELYCPSEKCDPYHVTACREAQRP